MVIGEASLLAGVQNAETDYTSAGVIIVAITIDDGGGWLHGCSAG